MVFRSPRVRSTFVAQLFVAVFAVGCSQGSAPPASVPPATAPPAPAPESGPPSVVGKAPAAKGGVATIVVLEPRGEATFPAQPRPPVMDQVSMTFIPATLLVRAGETTEFRNSDDVLHNVRVREEATKEPAFNVAIPTGQGFSFTFKRPGFYDVGCDIHPGMAAIVVAAPSPYAVIADMAGNFTIPDVAPGAYTAVAYSGADKIERPIDVAKGPTQVSFEAP